MIMHILWSTHKTLRGLCCSVHSTHERALPLTHSRSPTPIGAMNTAATALHESAVMSALPAPLLLELEDDDALALFDDFDLAAAVLDIDDTLATATSDFAIDSDTRASFKSLLSHLSDSDSCGFTSDTCDGIVGSPQQQLQVKTQRQSQPQQSKLTTQKLKTKSKSEPKTPAKMPVKTPVKKPRTREASTTDASATDESTPKEPPLKRPRKHNRIEILKLRDEVAQLEARAATLRTRSIGASSNGDNDEHNEPRDLVTIAPRRSANAATARVSSTVAAQFALRHGSSGLDTAASSVPHSVWLNVAVEQYAALRESQALNDKLRAALTKQRSVSRAFHSLIHKQATIKVRSRLSHITKQVTGLRA